MIVIADSGATKTQWRVFGEGRELCKFETIGLSPYFCSHDVYIKVLSTSFPLNPLDVHNVFFYSAGCGAAEKAELALGALGEYFSRSSVEVRSDILGAARALFGRGQGIAMILGTGTNIAYYDSTNVRHYSPSLGYVLGDEGSGAYLGKEFVRRWLYNEFPAELNAKIEKELKISTPEILQRVYSEPFPGRFLASFVPFMASNTAHPAIASIIRESFRNLAARHLKKYPMFPNVPLGVVGSIGVVFQSLLVDVLAEFGGSVQRFEQYPIDKLLEYHTLP